MTRTFRTATGRRVRVQVSEAEAWRIRGYRLVTVIVPAFWLVVVFRLCNFI